MLCGEMNLLIYLAQKLRNLSCGSRCWYLTSSYVRNAIITCVMCVWVREPSSLRCSLGAFLKLAHMSSSHTSTVKDPNEMSEVLILGPKLMVVCGWWGLSLLLLSTYALSCVQQSQSHTSIIFQPSTPVLSFEDAELWELWFCCGRNAHSKPRFDWGS